ncbi:hypothetical protein GCM10023201_41400 [Actinomycetospora corticicola]|uniref:Uncharacterized protein n=1 Tax=Actinomycetospora corticicola TaxID=663602 RepID=A0A7Y9J614_9PSEU|nr:hypothetical protein [Actinomycetospora corticicola]NYD36772.1 hypothetical protein [Actinomycetospora corticicola]
MTAETETKPRRLQGEWFAPTRTATDAPPRAEMRHVARMLDDQTDLCAAGAEVLRVIVDCARHGGVSALGVGELERLSVVLDGIAAPAVDELTLAAAVGVLVPTSGGAR